MKNNTEFTTGRFNFKGFRVSINPKDLKALKEKVLKRYKSGKTLKKKRLIGDVLAVGGAATLANEGRKLYNRRKTTPTVKNTPSPTSQDLSKKIRLAKDILKLGTVGVGAGVALARAGKKLSNRKKLEDKIQKIEESGSKKKKAEFSEKNVKKEKLKKPVNLLTPAAIIGTGGAAYLAKQASEGMASNLKQRANIKRKASNLTIGYQTGKVGRKNYEKGLKNITQRMKTTGGNIKRLRKLRNLGIAGTGLGVAGIGGSLLVNRIRQQNYKKKIAEQKRKSLSGKKNV